LGAGGGGGVGGLGRGVGGGEYKKGRRETWGDVGSKD